MTKQKLDNKPFNNSNVKKEYCRMVAHRIQSMIKRLKTFNQTRQHGTFNSQQVHISMENALHSLGHFNPHAGSFQLNNSIQQLLTQHDPLPDIQQLNPHI
eukprot:2412860-Pleurochrysis_carterae.AAC.1